MTVTTLAEAAPSFRQLCEKAVRDRDPVWVHGEDGEDVVILAADDYESLAETAHLLAPPGNARRLREAIAAARRGTTPPMSVEELRAAVGL
jgi:antitoxin YefM